MRDQEQCRRHAERKWDDIAAARLRASHAGHNPSAMEIQWLAADVLGWAGDKLLVPVLTGVAVGLALRFGAIRSDVTKHDARAAEIATDAMRWVRDRDRQLTAEIFRARNLARQGIIEDVEHAPVPQELEHLPPGDLGNSGAFVQRVERLMRQTLHEYRDEMSAKVREYESMARSEGKIHDAVRAWRERDIGRRPPRMRRRRRPPPALRLPADARAILATWREREVPVHATPTARVEDDPSRHPDAAADIAPLEADEGHIWAHAVRRSRTGFNS